MSLRASPLLRRIQDFGFALETTTGTLPTIAAADSVTAVYNPTIDYDASMVERQQQGTLSNRSQAVGAIKGTATFETDLVGSGTSGTDPIWALRLLLACGMQESSHVFTPLDASNVTIGLRHFINGRARSLAGAMGTFKMKFKRGEPVRIDWTFWGLQQSLASATVTPTYVSTLAPVCGTGTFTIDSTAYACDELTFDAGNVLYMRQNIGSAGGYLAAGISSRKPMVTVAPEAMLSKDWNAAFLAATTSALSISVGTTAGNTLTLAAPNMQQQRNPKDGNRDDTLVDQLEFLCLENTPGGMDEYSITLS